MAKQPGVLPRDQFMLVNGLRLRYLAWGASPSPPVVLLHGGSAHAHWWDRFAAAIANDYHVVAPDLRGHGDSGHACPPAYRVDDYVRDLAAFIAAQRFDRIDLVGHSLGGMVATAFAAQEPARIHALVVVDSQLKITPAGARYMVRLRNFPQPLYRSREQAIERFRLLPTQTAADVETLQHVAAHGIRELPDGRWTFKFDREAMAHHDPQDLTPALRGLKCPILLIRGAHSTLLSATALATLRAAAPHAEVAEIGGAHHHVMLDNPPEFERVVSTFLDATHQRASSSPHTLEPPDP